MGWEEILFYSNFLSCEVFDNIFQKPLLLHLSPRSLPGINAEGGLATCGIIRVQWMGLRQELGISNVHQEV